MVFSNILRLKILMRRSRSIQLNRLLPASQAFFSIDSRDRSISSNYQNFNHFQDLFAQLLLSLSSKKLRSSNAIIESEASSEDQNNEEKISHNIYNVVADTLYNSFELGGSGHKPGGLKTHYDRSDFDIEFDKIISSDNAKKYVPVFSTAMLQATANSIVRQFGNKIELTVAEKGISGLRTLLDPKVAQTLIVGFHNRLPLNFFAIYPARQISKYIAGEKDEDGNRETLRKIMAVGSGSLSEYILGSAFEIAAINNNLTASKISQYVKSEGIKTTLSQLPDEKFYSMVRPFQSDLQIMRIIKDKQLLEKIIKKNDLSKFYDLRKQGKLQKSLDYLKMQLNDRNVLTRYSALTNLRDVNFNTPEAREAFPSVRLTRLDYLKIVASTIPSGTLRNSPFFATLYFAGSSKDEKYSDKIVRAAAFGAFSAPFAMVTNSSSLHAARGETRVMESMKYGVKTAAKNISQEPHAFGIAVLVRIIANIAATIIFDKENAEQLTETFDDLIQSMIKSGNISDKIKKEVDDTLDLSEIYSSCEYNDEIFAEFLKKFYDSIDEVNKSSEDGLVEEKKSEQKKEDSFQESRNYDETENKKDLKVILDKFIDRTKSKSEVPKSSEIKVSQNEPLSQDNSQDQERN